MRKLKINMQYEHLCPERLRAIIRGLGDEKRSQGESQGQRIRKVSKYLLTEILTCYPAGLCFSSIVRYIIHILEEHMEIIENYK